MKHLLLFLFVLISLASYGQNKRTINVETAGTLPTLISDDEKYMIDELTLTGELNGTDFRLLRDMAGNNWQGLATGGRLRKIDLSGVKIVAGGENYVQTEDIVAFSGRTTSNTNGFIYTTEEDVFGPCMFAGCEFLQEIKLPSGIKSIKWYAFHFDSSLKELIIPKSVTYMDTDLHYGCSGLQSLGVEAGNTVYSSPAGSNAVLQGDKIVLGCSTTVIPGNVKTIGNSAFVTAGTSGDTYTIPEGITTIEIWNFVDGDFDEVILPKGLTTIGDYFLSWSRAKRLTIPSSVKKIGEYPDNSSINACYFLKEVTSKIKDPTAVQFGTYDVFTSLPDDATLYVPASSVEAYKATRPWNNFKKIEGVPETEYTLTYIVDGEVFKTEELSEGDAITPEPAPTKEGYTFSGWSEIPATMPANEVTVTGTFTVNKYKLIYQVDGAEYKKYDVEFGATITPEAAPTKEGYTFSGWSEIPAKMPAKDVTVTGTFTVNKYKLIYQVDGAEYKKYDVEYGTTITPEPAPTKDGYTFSGWSGLPTTMPAKDVMVTGSFTKNDVKTYTLTYKVDGEVYKTFQLEEGATITPEPALTKEGYTFSGWSDIPATMPANDVTVTGTFTKNEDPQEDPQDDPEPIAENNVQYEIEGGSLIITHVDNVSGDVTIEASVEINGKTYEVTIIAKEAFKDCTQMTSVDIPSSVTAIGEKAFDGCMSLRVIKIGKGILEIGRKAFANIYTSAGTRGEDGLHFYCDAEVVPATSAEAFNGTDIAHATLHVPDNMVETYKIVAPWNGFGTIVGFSETGIFSIIVDMSDVQIFDLQGNRIDKPRKGLNIIRTKDGKAKKVLVK